MSNDKTAKRRKYREIPSVRATPQETKATQDTVKRMLGRLPLAQDEPQSTETVSSPEMVSRPEIVASLEESQPVCQKISTLEIASSPETVSIPKENLASFAESLSYGKGHLRLNHDYFDKVLTLLNENEQLLFIHILRYREKQNNFTIRLNWPLLERRTHITGRTLSKVAKSLETKGLVSRFDYQFGKGIEQEFRFSISLPSSLAMVSSPEMVSRLETASDSNRSKELKEQDKRKSAPPDFQNCPDCHGTGFHYVDETDRGKGVEKCRHSKIRKGS